MQLVTIMLDGITTIDPRLAVLLTVVSIALGFAATDKGNDIRPFTHSTELIED